MPTLSTTTNRLRPGDIADLLKMPGSHKDGGGLYLFVKAGRDGRDARGAWRFQYRSGGKLTNQGLGPCPPVTLKEARAARDAIRATTRTGLYGSSAATYTMPTKAVTAAATASPAATSDKAEPIKVSPHSLFGDLTAPYLEIHKTEWQPEQFTRNGALLRLHAAALDARPCDEITADEVANMLRPNWTGPGNSTGSKVRGLIEKILDYAEVEKNPAAWSRLRNKLSTKAAATTPVASLPYAELPALMVELVADTSDAARALRFVILTGVRLNEALEATWREFDLKARTWTVPAERMKMKLEHRVPLSDAAIACLGERGADDDFIFPSKRGGKPMRAFDPWAKLGEFKRIDPLQQEPITPHGFRSTMSVWAQEQKPPFAQPVIDRALSHAERDKVRKVYLRSDLLDERRDLADRWSKFACGVKLAGGE